MRSTSHLAVILLTRIVWVMFVSRAIDSYSFQVGCAALPVSLRIISISNRYICSAGDHAHLEYARELRSMVLGKRGVLRGKSCSGVVEGSMRMVIIPCLDISRNEIMVPDYTRDTSRVPTRIRNGVETPIYGYEGISEDNYAIVISPPCLWKGNVQPKRVRFWNRTALRISPEVCESDHADFDGDEMQIYFLKDPRSIPECERWQ